MEEEMPLVPARMLNEYAYCPRLAYLEWVQGEFADSADTLEGRFRHQRVDQPGGTVPPASEVVPDPVSGDAIHARSVLISSERLAAIARIDLVEGEAGEVVPVDYKKGEVPDNPMGAWEPELVQLCLQGLILRDNGYNCQYGIIYYVASRRRVTVELTPQLITRTQELLAAFKETVSSGKIPQPLEDSHKCVRCSLAGICLPDELNYLAQAEEAGESGLDTRAVQAIRRLYPARDDAMPVYVQTQGLSVGKEGGVRKSKTAVRPWKRFASWMSPN